MTDIPRKGPGLNRPFETTATTRGRTHYIPGDIVNLPIQERSTACGIPARDIIKAFRSNDDGGDRYTTGLPRPGQITCGNCAVAVPHWYDPDATPPITPEAQRLLDTLAPVRQFTAAHSLSSDEVRAVSAFEVAYDAWLATRPAPPVPSIDNVHYSGSHLEVRFDNSKTIHIEFINPDLAADATIQIPTTKEQ